MDYQKIEEILGYTFHDKLKLDIAFTHKSYANEARVPWGNYERYEFLGDAILEMISSETLFRRYPEKPEGELTKLRASLVCEYTLSQITRALHFGDFLYLSHGEEMTGGRDRSSILCDLFESVLGAIYLDGGMEPARTYVNRFLLNDIEGKARFHDAKSLLQEYAQSKNKKLEYVILEEKGPEHDRTYVAAACLDGVKYAEGEGHNKKMAEQIAAHRTLKKLCI